MWIVKVVLLAFQMYAAVESGSQSIYCVLDEFELALKHAWQWELGTYLLGLYCPTLSWQKEASDKSPNSEKVMFLNWS